MLWLDGERLDGTCAPFDLRDRGLMLGDGVFDTAMVAGGQVIFGAAHLERLAGSCRSFGIPFAPDTVARMAEVIEIRPDCGVVGATHLYYQAPHTIELQGYQLDRFGMEDVVGRLPCDDDTRVDRCAHEAHSCRRLSR